MSAGFRYTLLPPAACLLLANASADPQAGIALEPPEVQVVAPLPPAPPLPLPPIEAVYYPPPPRNYGTHPRPANNPGSWVRDDDYPALALREERQGNTAVRLTIGKNGKVVDCQIVASSGSADLDTTTCQKIRQRARYIPARDAQGRKVEGTHVQRVNWILPEENLPLEAGLGVTSYIIAVDRTISDCNVDRVEGAALLQAALGPFPCAPGKRVMPPVDAQGKPMRKKVITTIEVKVEPVDP